MRCSGLRAVAIPGKFISFPAMDFSRNLPFQSKATGRNRFSALSGKFAVNRTGVFSRRAFGNREKCCSGVNFRSTLSTIRPYTPQMWRRFPLEERKRFVLHALPYWDIHRHRLAPAAHLRLSHLLESGQAEAVTGHILRCEVNRATYRYRYRTAYRSSPGTGGWQHDRLPRAPTAISTR